MAAARRAAGATLDLVNAYVSGNIVDNGAMVLDVTFAEGAVPNPVSVSGDVTVAGSLGLELYANLTVGGSLTVLQGAQVSMGSGSSVTADALALHGGTITATASDYAFISGAASVDGSATIEVGFGYLSMRSLGIAANGVSPAQLAVTSNGNGGTLAVTGALALGGGTLDLSAVDVTAASLALQDASAVSLDAASSLVIGGTLTLGGSTTLIDQGALSAQVLTGAGDITLENGGVATLDSVSGSPTLTFGNGDATLVLGQSSAIGLTLLGLHAGDTIDFPAVSSVPGSTSGAGGAAMSGGTLYLTGASGQTAQLAVTGLTAASFAVTPDASGGSLVVADAVPCYAAGTRILTEHGEIPVEALQAGDRVRTLSGRLAPVVWVGRTRIDLARHPRPQRAAPIRVAADAIAPGVPCRDLLLSPEHALFLDGALVPVWQLANGASIARQDGLAAITYCHVELDRHDIMLAEGCAAESYLDTGNRGLFANAGGSRPLHPAFDIAPDQAALQVWADRAAAPLLLGGTSVAALHASLLARAGTLGWHATDDAGLRALSGGQALPLSRASATCWRAHLPPGTATVRLRSRSFVPAERHRESGGTRRLGIAVTALLTGGWKLPPSALCAGWHAADTEDWRWTDGDATVRLVPVSRTTILEIRMEPLARYWRRATLSAARAA